MTYFVIFFNYKKEIKTINYETNKEILLSPPSKEITQGNFERKKAFVTLKGASLLQWSMGMILLMVQYRVSAFF